MSGQSASAPRISVIGLGNVLLGDDAFGPSVVELLRCHYECGPEVEFLDLGTPGLDLAPYLYGRELVIIADAVNAAGVPGTLLVCSLSDIPREQCGMRLTGHAPGLTSALSQLALISQAPADIVVVGAVPECTAFNHGVSTKVLNAASAAVRRIAGLLGNRGIHCKRRDLPFAPNLWWLSRDRVGKQSNRVALEG